MYLATMANSYVKKYTCVPDESGWHDKETGTPIERMLGVPEVVEMVRSRWFKAVRFGDHSCEWLVLKDVYGVLHITLRVYNQ